MLAASGIVASQDFVKGTQKGGPVELSGLSSDLFDGLFFQSDGWMLDMTSYGLTPSQAAFLADTGEGQPGKIAKKEPLRIGGM